MPRFSEVTAEPDPSLDAIALALASEFREVDVAGALGHLDALGEELAAARGASEGAEAQLRACVQILATTHGFTGDTEHYDAPANSMLDVVLQNRRGLPILLSVVYVEVARRAGIALAGVGLGGHFVVGHFGASPPLLIDPFARGTIIEAEVEPAFIRPWGNHEIAMRMLSNLVGSYQRRGDLDAAIRAAGMRLALPAPPALVQRLRAELRALQARLN